MKVLHVMEPGFGGVLRHVEGLVECQLQAGLGVALAYSSRRPSPRLFQLVARVRAAGGETLDLKVGNAPCPGDLTAARALSRLLGSGRVELVHAHSSKAGALGRVVARLGGRPCIYTPNAYFGMGRTGPRALLFNLVERLLGGLAVTVNVSPEERDFARSRLGVPARLQRLVPNGVDTDFFQPATAEQKAAARDVFGLPRQARVLGSLGRLTYQKDPETLYRSFARLLQSHPETWLLHLGEGELAGALEALLDQGGLRDRVRRLEALDDPRPFYHALDGFVLTSRYEGLPISALEALACDLPLVLTDAPGNRAFGSLGLNRLGYAPVGDVEAISAALESWLAPLGSPCNHRQVCCRELSLARTCARVLELYHEVLSPRKAALTL